jgi:hypothetical protein
MPKEDWSQWVIKKDHTHYMMAICTK